MRAVVIGGSGQIGGWLLHYLAQRGHEAIGTFATVPYPGLHRLDAAQPDCAHWVRAQEPDVLFYPAGFTWVDGCERDRARAYAANLEHPLRIAGTAIEAGARFVYFSTDYVFDGTAGPYQESDEPRPLNVYGQAKLEAEQLLTERYGDSVLIARTCWVFGPERQGKNFAYQVVRTLREGKRLPCPCDQWSNPSYGPNVALAAVQLAELRHAGLIHVAGPDWIDRVSFAKSIAEAFQVDSRLVEGVESRTLQQHAERPLRGGLRSEKFSEILPGLMMPLCEALGDFRMRLAESERWAEPGAG